MSDLSDSLTRTLLEICQIDSFIGEEAKLCSAIETRLKKRLGDKAVTRFRDNLIVHVGANNHGPKLCLAGHLDVVRTQHDAPARIEGSKLYGAGAADMKSGLALMIELAERLDAATLPCALTLIFYAGEEGPYEGNDLGPLLDNFQDLHKLDLVLCLEPSDNKLQLGCMGSLHGTMRFQGTTAHSARPWQGKNAIYTSIATLSALSKKEPEVVTIDGLEFKEVMTPTLASGGRSRNIVPDKFDVNVNYRFAPHRSVEDAIQVLRSVMEPGSGEFEVVDCAPPGKPHGQHPLIQHLITCGVRAVEPKQAWTDVGRFSQLGVAAANFGPGTNAQAHQRNEYTELGLLEEGYQILERFITTARAQ